MTRSGCISKAIFLVIIIFGSLTGTTSAFGQANARLTGVVKDSSGATVPSAMVTITNQGTNQSRTAKTDNDGVYLFSLVDVGAYNLTVEHSGFKKYVRTGIVLEINQNGRVDVTLEVGRDTETVEVTAGVPQVDTSGAVLGKVEDTKRIQDLPLVDRDTLQLGLLQAGVFTPDPDDGSNNPFNVSGQRSESLTFLVDGADNTDFLSNNIVVSPNPDAVGEFKILTNNYDAEFGRSSGGIVNQVIKSGTNSLHGSLFEFLRNDVLNAKDYFLPADQPKAAFKRNVFGGSAGAPVIRDKTFIFGSYQGARRREGQVAPQATVLSANERKGDFSELCPNPNGPGADFDANGNCLNPTGTQLSNPGTGNPYPFNQIPVNPISANYIAKYLPLPNDPLGGNGYRFAATAATDEDQGILRVDHNLTKRDTLSAVYLINDVRDAFPFIIGKGASSGGNLPNGSGFTDKFRNQNLSLSYTHSFARGWINEARVSANRTATLQAVPTDKTTPAELGYTNINPDDGLGASLPIIYTIGFNIGPSPQGPTKLHDMTFQYQDHVTIPHGRHEWKFGADVRRVQNNFNYDFYNNGSYDFGLYGDGGAPNGTMTGDYFADFVGGFPDNYYQAANAVYAIRTTSSYFYAQDTFKIRPRLTLVLGVRYEYNSPQTDVHNNIIGYFGPNAQSTVFPGAPPGILYPGDPGTPNKALVYPDKNNWAPRVGFAWDTMGNAKFVVRGGFGIFYDIEDGALNLQFGGQPPFGYIANFLYYPSSFSNGDANYLTDPFTLNGPSTVNPYPFRAGGHTGEFFVPAIPFAYVTDPHFRTPYSENYNFGIQYQLTKSMALEVVYVGSLGRKLISSIDVNPPNTQSADIRQQLLDGSLTPECARPLANCDADGNLQNIGQLITNKSVGLSDSHQLQVTLDRSFSHGLSFRAAYTYAKTIDTSSGFRSRSGTITDPFNPRLDRAAADFDVRHRLVFSGSWEVPTGNYVKDHRALRYVLADWQANVIASFQAGTPITLYSNDNQSFQDNLLDRVDVVNHINLVDPRKPLGFSADCNSFADSTVPAHFWFDPTAFSCSSIAPFTFGTLGRNSIRGPGFQNWDLSFLKKFKISESKYFEFRGEMFNAFNHVNFLNPDTNGFSSTFGQISTTRGPRLVQFGLKFYF